MANFNLNAFIRGAQLTLVGANRALQNPGLFTSKHYRQAALAVAAGIIIRIILAIPAIGVRILLWVLSVVIDMDKAHWDDVIVGRIHFFEHSVLQAPIFFMTLMRYVTPTLDEMFMNSLQWVDQTYMQKHKSEDPRTLRALYYPNLRMYQTHAPTSESRSTQDAVVLFLQRYGRRAGISLAVYALSCLPYIGWLVLPAASFYTFRKAVGLQPALIIFGGFLSWAYLFESKRPLVTFLQSFFSSRSLMRELLEPYFSRIRYTSEQKKRWFKDREAVLFGFGLGFFTMVKIPLVGVLIYGIAEASTAYLITKITEPPPPPSEAEEFKKNHLRWHNQQDFLSLPLDRLDALNIHTDAQGEKPTAPQTPRPQFS